VITVSLFLLSSLSVFSFFIHCLSFLLFLVFLSIFHDCCCPHRC
jgi:hypothetical protein